MGTGQIGQRFSCGGRSPRPGLLFSWDVSRAPALAGRVAEQALHGREQGMTVEDHAQGRI